MQKLKYCYPIFPVIIINTFKTTNLWAATISVFGISSAVVTVKREEPNNWILNSIKFTLPPALILGTEVLCICASFPFLIVLIIIYKIHIYYFFISKTEQKYRLYTLNILQYFISFSLYLTLTKIWQTEIFFV